MPKPNIQDQGSGKPARLRRHQVEVDGVMHRSFYAAALAVRVIKEGDSTHQAARIECKKKGKVKWKGKVFVLGPEY